MGKQDNNSPAQKKFISHLIKRTPDINEKDISFLLSSFKRFVNVVRRLYTEPQAQIIYKDKKSGKQTIRQRIITTDLEELKKVINKEKSPQSIREVFSKFNKAVTKDKYGR